MQFQSLAGSPTNDMKDKLLPPQMLTTDRNSINKDVTNPIGDEIKEMSESAADFDLKIDPLGLGLSPQNREELSKQQLEKLKFL